MCKISDSAASLTYRAVYSCPSLVLLYNTSSNSNELFYLQLMTGTWPLTFDLCSLTCPPKSWFTLLGWVYDAVGTPAVFPPSDAFILACKVHVSSRWRCCMKHNCFSVQKKNNVSSVFHCRNNKQMFWNAFIEEKKHCVINYKAGEFSLEESRNSSNSSVSSKKCRINC